MNLIRFEQTVGDLARVTNQLLMPSSSLRGQKKKKKEKKRRTVLSKCTYHISGRIHLVEQANRGENSRRKLEIQLPRVVEQGSVGLMAARTRSPTHSWRKTASDVSRSLTRPRGKRSLTDEILFPTVKLSSLENWIFYLALCIFSTEGKKFLRFETASTEAFKLAPSSFFS